MRILFYLLAVTCLFSCSTAQIKVGAAQYDKYKSFLAGKRIGLVVNHTSIINDVHLVDFLLSKKLNIKKVFAPEHGFRGTASAGEHIQNQVDEKTSLPIISLYGNNKKPSEKELENLDIIIFDIQDVGVRFYTYISTMHYVMEACAEQGITVLILDRPNPNGYYVAGPILDTSFKSFVGMHPIPIVHGLTIGELAEMINQEKWMKNGIQCDLKIINCTGYTHNTKYSLPIKPSPNLPNATSVNLYPSLCLFEATNISVGRGTSFPFQVVGAPQYKNSFSYTFTPKSKVGAQKPKHENTICYGIDLSNSPSYKFTLKYIIDFYKKRDQGVTFFKYPKFFNKLAGTDKVMKMIIAGKSSKEIEETWIPQLEEYLTLRSKYLHYPDFTE